MLKLTFACPAHNNEKSLPYRKYLIYIEALNIVLIVSKDYKVKVKARKNGQLQYAEGFKPLRDLIRHDHSYTNYI